MTSALTAPLAPFGPTPSPRQLAWHRMETCAFVHFGPNTFTGLEWGHGTEDPNRFNPTNLDCDQWVREFKRAGFKGVILTAKHHDGFCLWPSRLSEHTVRQSKWKNGQGDVLRELSQACKRGGLKLGVYLSPWDRNHPKYGTDAYNDVFVGMLEEVLSGYGPIFEVWFDGANGEGPNGKRQVYDWPRYVATVRRLQPNAVIFSDAGPDIRWVGNENGEAGETNWNRLHSNRYMPGTPKYVELTEGQADGTDWVPAECDVSIRPGWFWRESENDAVKRCERLFEIYERSVGHGANLLLNIPPDSTGQIHSEDIHRLYDFRRLVKLTYDKNLAAKAKVETSSAFDADHGGSALTDGNAKTYWAPAEADGMPSVTLDLGKPTILDRIQLREPVALGQRIAKFSIEIELGGQWQEVANGTTVGVRRIVPIAPVQTSRIRVRLLNSLAPPLLSEVAAFATPTAQYRVHAESLEAKNTRMAWWRDARYGMFIHWGLYAIPGGEWNGKPIPGTAEWIKLNARIKNADYHPLQAQFNPVRFDAKAWAKLAKAAGMRYVVLTTKHHDGFGLWDSKLTEWDVMGSPFRRDIVRELAEACRAEGLRFGMYHSILDWTHPDWRPRPSWEGEPGDPSQIERFEKYLYGQLKELLTGYGPVDVVWFDGEWIPTWTHERGMRLYDTIRKLQPKTLVNNRVDIGREGMAGLTASGGFAGDFGTPEQEVPAGGLPGTDWESCMTLNDTWGFSKRDQNWKSAKDVVRILADCVSKGGNFLLNVGPDASGVIPKASADILQEVGHWLDKFGEAIYGSGLGPARRNYDWGRITRKGNRLYVIVFEPGATDIVLRGLRLKAKSMRWLADSSEKVTMRISNSGPVLSVPPRSNSLADVIAIELEGEPETFDVPVQPDPSGILTLNAVDADIAGGAKYEADKRCIGYWTRVEDAVSWRASLDQSGQYKVAIEFACQDADAGSTVIFEAGKQRLEFVVPRTGGWNQFVTQELGTLELKGGVQTLRVTVKAKPHNAVMNLRAIRLDPVRP